MDRRRMMMQSGNKIFVGIASSSHGLDLGIIPNIEHSYEIIAKRTENGWFYGAYVIRAGEFSDFGLANNAFRFGGRYKTGLPNFADGEFHIFFNSKDKSVVDGVDFGKQGDYYLNSERISLFRPSRGSVSSPKNCIVREFKEYDENMVLIHDFVAVDEPNFVGFRDTITGEEKTIQGLYAVYEYYRNA